MKYGIAMFPTDYAIPIDELARELEARAFESVWLRSSASRAILKLPPAMKSSAWIDPILVRE